MSNKLKKEAEKISAKLAVKASKDFSLYTVQFFGLNETLPKIEDFGEIDYCLENEIKSLKNFPHRKLKLRHFQNKILSSGVSSVIGIEGVKGLSQFLFSIVLEKKEIHQNDTFQKKLYENGIYLVDESDYHQNSLFRLILNNNIQIEDLFKKIDVLRETIKDITIEEIEEWFSKYKSQCEKIYTHIYNLKLYDQKIDLKVFKKAG